MRRIPLLIILFLLFASLKAQNVINNLGTNGKFVVLDGNQDTSLVDDDHNFKVKLGENGRFVILNNGTPGIDEFVKFLIRESGEVNWYLDGQNMFIRESNFEYEPGKFGTYDYFFVDGTNGRLGFNVLSNTLGGLDDNLPLNSSVNLFGSIATRVRVLDGSNNYAIKQDDHIMIIDKQDNGVNDMVLPSVSISKGRELYFKRNGFGDGEISVKPQPGEQLNGVVDSDVGLNKDNASMMVVCDGDSWWLMTEIEAAAQARITINTTTALTKKEDVVEVNFTAANQSIDVDLPTAADSKDKRFEIKRNANGNTFAGNILRILPLAAGTEHLDQYTNANPYIMSNNFASVTIESNGTQWLIINNYDADEALVTVAANYTPKRNDKTILVNGQFTVTLPNATTLPVGKTYTVKRINSGGSSTAPTVAATGGQTFDGLTNVLLNQRTDYITVQNDGSNWQVVSDRISPSFVINPTLPYTASPLDGIISSNQTGTVNLPSTANVLGGKIFVIKNTSPFGPSTTLTIDPFGSQTIDGSTTVALTWLKFLTIQSDGSNWIIIGH